MNLASGVARYRTAYCLVKIQFPVDFKGNESIDCNHCDLFQKSSGRCPLTHMISEYPDRYVGSHCPLELEEDDDVKLEVLGIGVK